MFITEAQLAIYKYQVSGKYYSYSMSYIARQEFIEFAKVSNAAEDVIECFSHFWNRKIAKNVWHISFSDNSSLLIRKVLKDEKINYEFRLLPDFDIDSIFSD